MQSPNGGWLTDRNDIGNCFVSHFNDLFASSTPTYGDELLNLFDCSVSAEDNTLLCAIPSEFEIYAALASLGTSKAPGPDGFTSLFYMKYWECIKLTVLKAVWNLFRNNHFLKEQNHTFLALIPKKLGASSVQHYRPINLCNIIYKIISKIIATRLTPLLHNIISPFQTAFVPSRHIQDNSILAHEMFHTLKSKRGRGGLIAVHLDTFCWQFFKNLDFTRDGFIGFDYVFLHPLSQSYLMVVLLVYSPRLGVSGKVTHFHRFSSLLDLK